MLSEGRLLNLGNATGHPSFVMSNSFSNQVLAQIELFTRHANYENKVYVLPKHLDEKIARVHVEALGAHLTTMSPSNPRTSTCPSGPYKSDHYRSLNQPLASRFQRGALRVPAAVCSARSSLRALGPQRPQHWIELLEALCLRGLRLVDATDSALMRSVRGLLSSSLVLKRSRRGKERAASLRAQQRLAAGGPQGSPGGLVNS